MQWAAVWLLDVRAKQTVPLDEASREAEPGAGATRAELEPEQWRFGFKELLGAWIHEKCQRGLCSCYARGRYLRTGQRHIAPPYHAYASTPGVMGTDLMTRPFASQRPSIPISM